MTNSERQIFDRLELRRSDLVARLRELARRSVAPDGVGSNLVVAANELQSLALEYRQAIETAVRDRDAERERLAAQVAEIRTRLSVVMHEADKLSADKIALSRQIDQLKTDVAAAKKSGEIDDAGIARLQSAVEILRKLEAEELHPRVEHDWSVRRASNMVLHAANIVNAEIVVAAIRKRQREKTPPTYGPFAAGDVLSIGPSGVTVDPAATFMAAFKNVVKHVIEEMPSANQPRSIDVSTHDKPNRFILIDAARESELGKIPNHYAHYYGSAVPRIVEVEVMLDGVMLSLRNYAGRAEQLWSFNSESAADYRRLEGVLTTVKHRIREWAAANDEQKDCYAKREVELCGRLTESKTLAAEVELLITAAANYIESSNLTAAGASVARLLAARKKLERMRTIERKE